MAAAIGEAAETFGCAANADAKAARDRAEASTGVQRAMSFEEWAAIVTRVAELFEERKRKLAEIAAPEMGGLIEGGW